MYFKLNSEFVMAKTKDIHFIQTRALIIAYQPSLIGVHTHSQVEVV